MIKIVVADDEAIEREAIAYIIANELASSCVLAGAAANGADAVRVCQEVKPDMVFLDIRMPVMDGLAAAEQIRAADPATRIVLASAYDDFRYAQRAIRLGVTDYLLKPVQPDEVVRQIQALMADLARRRDPALRARFAADLLSSQPQGAADWESRARELGLPGVPERAAFLLSDRPMPELDHFTGLRVDRPDGIGLLLPAGERLELPGPHAYAGVGSSGRLAASLGEARVAAYLARARRERRVLHYSELAEPARLVAHALIYLHEHYAGECSLEAVATRFAVSPAHFSRVFSREAQTGFATYLSDLRVAAGARLLAGTDRSVEQVAREAGFSSLHYFSAVFKRATGLAPTDYRQRSRAHSGEVAP